MKKILFITWDGPQTNYLEGLFLPIFNEIKKDYQIEFHIIQFTWADEFRTSRLADIAEKLEIKYLAVPILRKPIAVFGGLFSLFMGKRTVERYIKEHQIDIVMPRSTMPAIMVNNIKKRNFKVIFDADGLPLEERVDFSGLAKDSLQYKLLKKQEGIILRFADRVITRSKKSIDIHVNTIGESCRSKFSVVINGRDIANFKRDKESRAQKRAILGVQSWEKLFVYCGSMGSQYCWEEMADVFSKYALLHPAKWLIIGNEKLNIDLKIDESLVHKISIISANINEVPAFLSAADVAFALRKPAFSMQGVAPIKLGEYLLMGLPTIASKGIGDTEEILRNFESCFLYDHTSPDQNAKVLDWLKGLGDNIIINRNRAEAAFSLKKAAESYINVLKELNA